MTTTDADREWARARLIAVQAMLEELRDNPSAFSPAALSGVAIRALEALAATRAEALEQAAKVCETYPTGRGDGWKAADILRDRVRALIATLADTGEEVMTVAKAQVPDDHPLMIAWEKYRASEEAANSDKWARALKVSEPMQGQIIVTHPHLVDSLWAAFMAGFIAAGGKTP